MSGQIDIFGSMGAEDNLPGLHLELPAQPASTREQLSWEKDLLGLYLSHHPLDDFVAYLDDNCQPVGAITAEADGKMARVGGLITTVRKIMTKNGATMAFVGLEDKSGLTELIVFPRAYEASPEVFEPDQVIMASGKISARDREGRLTSEPKILLETAKIIDYDMAKAYKPRPGAKPPAMTAASVPAWQQKRAGTAPARPTAAPAARPAMSTSPGDPAAGQLVLRIENLSDQALLLKLKETLGAFPGEAETYVVTGATPGAKRIRLPFKVTVSDGLVSRLGELLGQDRVARVGA